MTLTFQREKTLVATPPRERMLYAQSFGQRILFADEVCEDFDPRRETFLSAFELQELGQDHYRVWKAVTHGGEGPYGFATFLPLVEPRLAFNNPAARDAFDAWMRAYETRFFAHASMQENVVPPLPESGFVGGHVVPHRLDRDTDGGYLQDSDERAQSLFETWCWIVEHTRGQVWYFGDRFMFEDQNSAFSYKLRWG